MPELHQLTPMLTSLLGKGFQVGLLTDGRMSGASGAVPAAIHTTPECLSGGMLARVRDGDVIRIDSHTGVLEAKVPEDVLRARTLIHPVLSGNETGIGRELFKSFRTVAGDAEAGAMACMS
jgi:phosphogluconate dehydratase